MERITLRQWRDSDLEPYVLMNGDPEVTRYFPSVLSRAQSEASLVRQRALIEQRGWGLWALDVDGAFAGFAGLAIPTFRGSIHAMCRSGLAASARILGTRHRVSRGRSSCCIQVHRIEAAGDCVVYRCREYSFSTPDGAIRLCP